MKFETKAIVVAEEPDVTGNKISDVVAPIHLSSTFARKDFTTNIHNFEYSRKANPTRSVLESKIAALENGKYGIAYASGQAAECSLVLSLLKPNDEIICFHDVYGGTRRILSEVFSRFNIFVKYVDLTNIDNIKPAISSNTKLIWIESPTNPLLQLCDIPKICDIARKHKIISVVDNTFSTPYIQKPLDLGADIVMHSMTKYINGHSDSISGALVLNNDDLYEKIKYTSVACGGVLGAFDSYLNIRGIKTLKVRMEEHCKNAFGIARFLEAHKKVNKVLYPGLESHPQHELAKQQMNGLYGGVVSFYLDADISKVNVFAKNLHLFSLADSLGGVESLFGCPYYMSHESLDDVTKENLGITKNLIRLSVGLEDVKDLIESLGSALDKI